MDRQQIRLNKNDIHRIKKEVKLLKQEIERLKAEVTKNDNAIKDLDRDK